MRFGRYEIGLFQENNGEEERGEGEFWGYGISRCIKESKCIFQGLIKNNVKFLGVIKKKSCGTSIRVLVLGLKISDGCNTYKWSS